MFAKKTHIGTRIPRFKKCVTSGYKACVFMFADQTTWLGFPDTRKRQNNYIIFLFIRYGLYTCSCRKVTFILSVIPRETSWTKNAVNLYFCICALAKPFELLNTYFSCFGLFISNIYKVHNMLSLIAIQHTWRYQSMAWVKT